MKPKKTHFYSWKTGKLAKGCSLCVTGSKLVLFVTGLCSKKCFYCPISEKKMNKDVIYANEWKLENENDTQSLIKEAELTEARGAGITGGDPFCRLERTARYIRLLKKRFGREFHIHLYAPLELITEGKLRKLHKAGLDEIRVHPDFNDRKHWNKIGLIRRFSWDIGMEIPAIPSYKKKTIGMIDYFKDRIDFLNVNELEISDTNAQQLVERGFRPKDRISYGVKGSQELAIYLLKKYGKKLDMHYCTTTLKDRVQLASRIRIRAKNIAQPYDIVTEEGMLVRGALYLDELIPGFGYRKKLEKLGKNKRKRILAKLNMTMKKFKKDYKIKKGYMRVDDSKLRLLTSPAMAKLIKENFLKGAIVTEYPTWDQTEVEVVFV